MNVIFYTLSMHFSEIRKYFFYLFCFSTEQTGYLTKRSVKTKIVTLIIVVIKAYWVVTNGNPLQLSFFRKVLDKGIKQFSVRI